MTDSISVLIKAYCLFSFICFERPELINEKLCPISCRCFKAPTKNNANKFEFGSLVCTDIPGSEKIDLLPDEINTMVLDVSGRNSFRSGNYKFSKKRNIHSLVLKGFTSTMDSLNEFLPSIVDLVVPESLINLQILEWTHTASKIEHVWFDFKMIDKFESLEVIRMDRCHRSVLDDHFRLARLPKLHTLMITKSKLEYIDDSAFNGKAGQLKRLMLSENELTGSLQWITECQDTFDRLWFLDLSHNQLRYLPENLAEKLPALQTFLLEGNNIQWFKWEAIGPLVSRLGEFRLAIDSDPQLLYLYQPMEWLADADRRESIRSLYTADSFINGFRYFGFKKFQTFSELMSTDDISNVWLHNQPVQLNLGMLGDRGRLQIIHCDVNGKDQQLMERILVTGYDIIVESDDYFTVPFMEKRAMLSSLYPPATIQSVRKVVVRVPLFNQILYDYLKGGQFYPQVVSAMTRLAVEFLDGLYIRNQYAIFILWPEHFFHELSISNPDEEKENEFLANVLRPLAKAISGHPALVGIEITDDSFPQLHGSQEVPQEDTGSKGCPYPPGLLLNIEQHRYFLSVNADLLRKAFGSNVLIGFGFKASCRPCLPLLLIKQCMPPPVDFLTIRSQTEVTLSNDYYHHSKLTNEFDNWFNQNKHIDWKRGKNLFYSFYNPQQNIDRLDPNIERDIEQYTMGYFIPYYPINNNKKS